MTISEPNCHGVHTRVKIQAWRGWWQVQWLCALIFPPVTGHNPFTNKKFTRPTTQISTSVSGDSENETTKVTAKKLKQIWAVPRWKWRTGQQPRMIKGTIGEGGREGECSACVQPSFSLFPGDGRTVGRSGDGHAISQPLLGFLSKTNKNSIASYLLMSWNPWILYIQIPLHKTS